MKMKKQNVYILREYILIDDYGGVRIDEEAVFLTFEEAKDCLNSLIDDDIDEDSFAIFRIEIVEYELGNTDTFIKKWLYNLKGKLIDTEPRQHPNNEEDAPPCEGEFCVGDIIYVSPKIHNNQSPCVEGTLGVVVETPQAQNGNSSIAENEFNSYYTIYYISDKGLLDHLHAKKSVLSPANNIPIELRLITLLSKHFREEVLLPDDLLERLLNENIFVKNTQTFDFINRRIRFPLDKPYL